MMILWFILQVEYNSQGFLEKNRDTIPPGMIQLLQHSENKLISQIFSGLLLLPDFFEIQYHIA